MHTDAESHLPGNTPERVVVDETFDNGTARLLRAWRDPAYLNDSGLGIETWGEEKEEIWEIEDVELFVGFPLGRRLREGDVFFIRDGSLFTTELREKHRKKPPENPLLIGWNESAQKARDEIKEEFFTLTASRIAKETKAFQSLKRQVRRKIAGEIENI